MHARPKLTGAVLAGGAGRRMGGEDKGLIHFHDRPLIAWVIEALAPQVDELIIVANRNLDAYRAWGHPVVSDQRPDFAGPLAGFEAALTHASHEWVITCPTDAPLLPADYADLMLHAAAGQAAVAVIENQWQPVFSLVPRASLRALSVHLDEGERKLRRWLESLAPVPVPLDMHADAFRDADTLDALRNLEVSER